MSIMTGTRSARGAARLLVAITLLYPAMTAAQDFEFEEEPARRSIGAVLDLSRSLGDLNVFADRGIGGSLNARFPWRGSRLVSLRGDLSVGSFSGDGQIGGSRTGSAEWSSRFTSASAAVGFQFTADNEVLRPYLHAGAGLGLAGSVLSPESPSVVRQSSSGAGFAWLVGLGAYRIFGESEREWALDVGLRLAGMPSVRVPQVRVLDTANPPKLSQDLGSGSRFGWSFSIGVHFSP